MAPIARYLLRALLSALLLAGLALAAPRPSPTNKWRERALRDSSGAPLVPASNYPADDSTGAPGTRPGYMKFRTGNGASGKPGMQELNPGGDAPHAVEARKARKARAAELEAKKRNAQAAQAVQETKSADKDGGAAGDN